MNLLSLFAALVLSSCHTSEQPAHDAVSEALTPEQTKNLATATFAGGCFWCMEAPFDKLPGVLSTISGYTGGFKKNPTYEEVSAGATGHAEAVQVTYDSTKITYLQLLQVFWQYRSTRGQSAVLRRRLAISLRRFLSQRNATQTRGSDQARAGRLRSLQTTGCHGDRRFHGVLSGGRISSGFL